MNVNPVEAADLAYHSSPWYLTSDLTYRCVTKADFTNVQTSARTLLQDLEAAKSLVMAKQTPAIQYNLAMDGE